MERPEKEKDQQAAGVEAKLTSGRRRRRPAAGPPPRLAWGGGGGGIGGGGNGGGSRAVVGSSSAGGPTPAPRSSAGPSHEPSPSSLSGAHSGGGSIGGSGGGGNASSASFKAATTTGTSANKGAAAERKSKRAKRSGFQSNAAAAAAVDGADPSSMLWMDKHAPTDDASALCVAPKKVKDIREWMVRSSSSADRQCSSSPLSSSLPLGGGVAPRLLILVGSPGVGKSTMIRVLSAEMGWTVHEWNDVHHQPTQQQRDGLGCTDYDSLLSVRYQGQLASFEDFLRSAGTGFSSLDVTGGGGSGAQSASQSSSSSSAFAGTSAGKNKTGKSKFGGGKKRPANNDRLQQGTDGRGGAIILIEEVPNLHTAESAAQFRAIMTDHVRRSQTPTVLIFSDVCEGKHRPADLERLIDPSVLYSQDLVRILQIHAVAKPKMRKCLQSIARAERLGEDNDLPDTLWEELHASSGGDLRHAIMALQFRYAVHGRRDHGDYGGGKTDERGLAKGCRDRDTKLSTFHALGKLLYAKRRKVDGVTAHAPSAAAFGCARLNDNRPPLEFVPEDVMNQGDIEHGGALSFLSYHSPDFFTDEMELSRAFELFSDASLFVDREFSSQRDRSDAIFPLEYVSSIAGRAVADANKHPAPNRFRQLNAPRIFEVMRKKRGNDVKMLQLCSRLSRGSDILPLEANVGSSNHFVVDTLPYLRTVVPHEVDYALANLHSYARPEGERTTPRLESIGDLLRKKIKEQNLILAGDDIVDDDDSVENELPDGNERMPDAKGGIQKSTLMASQPEVIVID